MAHVLVVGGIGRLSAVSLFLASKGNVVTAIARKPERLAELAAQAGTDGARLNLILADYRNPEILVQALRTASVKSGNFNLALSWTCASAPHSRKVIGDFLNQNSPVCRYFEILGNEDEDPSECFAGTQDELTAYQRVLYRRILLGYVPASGGPRWPTRDEITDYTIRAMRDDVRESVVGTLKPWEARPRSA